ncbi:MAG: hypothetical protein J6N54_04405 [Bacteroidales bacterium]|nr:hypothetical protein [Bacteroidales bacterium]
MKEKTSALRSEYIIDGIPKRFTPADILDGCLDREPEQVPDYEEFEPIVDESVDPCPASDQFRGKDAQEYLSGVLNLLGTPRNCPMTFPEEFTKSRIAKALLDTLWMRGHFRLSDLTLSARWRWNPKPLGNMASFYSSVEAAADYIDSLGICLGSYSFTESDRVSQMVFKVAATDRQEVQEDEQWFEDEEIDLPTNAPFGSPHPVIGRKRAVTDKLVPDPESWIIFIPFDSCELRLGSSLLCEAYGQNGDPAPEIGDGDYFIDCFEVVREFVEDKVVLSGRTVGDGGLLSALNEMCGEDTGAKIDISGIMNAYDEDMSARVLFAEIPGAIIQIKDIDYDYADAEFLLQDIAYYPIGHPVPGDRTIKVKSGRGGGISDILQSLLNSQASEGED